MNIKKVFKLIAAVLIILIAALWINKDTTPHQETEELGGQIVGSNGIYVADCPLGTLVPISYVNLESSGFVVIQQDASDKPGKILGVSQLLKAGESTKIIPVSLLRMSKDKERLYAVLYLDDGNGTFDFAKDKPAIDVVTGENVMMIFSATADASTPSAINP
jgi:hypothetical protein